MAQSHSPGQWSVLCCPFYDCLTVTKVIISPSTECYCCFHQCHYLRKTKRTKSRNVKSMFQPHMQEMDAVSNCQDSIGIGCSVNNITWVHCSAFIYQNDTFDRMLVLAGVFFLYVLMTGSRSNCILFIHWFIKIIGVNFETTIPLHSISSSWNEKKFHCF